MASSPLSSTLPLRRLRFFTPAFVLRVLGPSDDRALRRLEALVEDDPFGHPLS